MGGERGSEFLIATNQGGRTRVPRISRSAMCRDSARPHDLDAGNILFTCLTMNTTRFSTASTRR